jgi:uncharacterized protein (TIGR02246 family)
MDLLEQMVAERACERLVYRYAQHVDFGQAALVADLFTEDGVWLGADGRGMHGPEAIRAAFGARETLTRRQSRHVMTNVLVDVSSADEAVGIAYLINYRHDSDTGEAEHPAPAGHPKFMGEYHLEFRRVGGRWLIVSLRFNLAFLRRRSGS